MSGHKFISRAAVVLAILAVTCFMYVQAGLIAALYVGGIAILILITPYLIWRPTLRQPPLFPQPPQQPPTDQPLPHNPDTRAKELSA